MGCDSRPILQIIGKFVIKQQEWKKICAWWFDGKIGMRQVGTLSPLHFNMGTNCIKGICTNKDSEITMAYADGKTIITENQIKLQDATNRWQEG